MSFAPPTKLLIVDDDPRMRQVIKEILGDMKCEILEGSHGEEAIHIASEQHPDCVIMDIEMPVMDGLTATRSIRQDDADIRVLILSKHDSPQFRQAAYRAGASGYVLKDNLSELREFIERPPSRSSTS